MQPVFREHVFKREYLVNAILEAGSITPDIEGKFIACVVSKCENDDPRRIEKQIPGIDGRDRYRTAKIEVNDSSKGTHETGFGAYNY